MSAEQSVGRRMEPPLPLVVGGGEPNSQGLAEAEGGCSRNKEKLTESELPESPVGWSRIVCVDPSIRTISLAMSRASHPRVGIQGEPVRTSDIRKGRSTEEKAAFVKPT